MRKPVFVESLDVRVTPESVLRRMGGRLSRKKWGAPVFRIWQKYWGRVRPRGVYRPAICLPDGDTIHVGGEFEFNSRFLTGLVEAPREGAIFLVTIGADLEQSIREEMEHGRNRNAFILDCLGSSAAEGAANALHRNIQRRFGLRMRRYSPGYNDWDVSEQRVLFEFLGRENAGQIGVELTPDFMMTPRKSVSGIILPRSRIRPARINPPLVPGMAET